MLVELYVCMKIYTMCRGRRTTLPFLQPGASALTVSTAPFPGRAWEMLTTVDHLVMRWSRWPAGQSPKLCQAFLRPVTVEALAPS
jgi:hypothetical protein